MLYNLTLLVKQDGNPFTISQVKSKVDVPDDLTFRQKREMLRAHRILLYRRMWRYLYGVPTHAKRD